MATKNSLKNKKILITCGPTWVPIDQVRVISNKSTGELGNTLACRLTKEGAKVTLLQGPVTHKLTCRLSRLIKFKFYDELSQLLKQESKKRYNVIIHAAAVSDYTPRSVCKSKLRSSLKQLKLNLKPTEKIILKIKKYNKKASLVGFKLGFDLKRRTVVQKTSNLFKGAKCDLVVANSVNNKNYRGYIINKRGNILAYGKSRKAIINNLIKSIKTDL